MRAIRTSGAPEVHVVVFEPGDEPIAGLTEVAGKLGLDAASFTAIGAFQRAVVGWFDLDQRDYQRIPVDEQVEVLSLIGDVTRDADAGTKVHAHVVLGRRDGTTVGGHLLEASVRPTLEVVLAETPAQLRRRHDPSTGLALIDLAAAGGAVTHTTGGTHGQDRR